MSQTIREENCESITGFASPRGKRGGEKPERRQGRPQAKDYPFILSDPHLFDEGVYQQLPLAGLELRDVVDLVLQWPGVIVSQDELSSQRASRAKVWMIIIASGEKDRKPSALGENQSALWFRDWSSKFLCGIYPLLDHNFNVVDRLFVGGAICHAARQFRNFSDEGMIFIAPIDDQFIANQSYIPRAYILR